VTGGWGRRRQDVVCGTLKGSRAPRALAPAGEARLRQREWAAAAGLATALGLVSAAGCGEPCCTVDTYPIPLSRAAAGELLASFEAPQGPTPGLVDTGSPVSFWAASEELGPARVVRRDLTLLGSPAPLSPAPVRARLHDVLTIEAPLGTVGTDAQPLAPLAVLGSDVLARFSVEFAFAIPQMTFWRRQPANDGYLGSVGYAVLQLPRRGGGELLAVDPKDSLGRRQPHRFGPSRLLLRTCAVPAIFDRAQPAPTRCCPGEERRFSTGTDLALLLATGVGPVVLGRNAWERVRAQMPAGTAPALTPGSLHVPYAARPVPALFTQLPRIVLVDAEADPDNDPGPCGELARARRLELVAISQSANAQRAACSLPCDRDPTDRTRAQNSAAYVELDGALEVAVVEDTVPFLQAIRLEVRPRGPEVDGLLGAAALASTRVELDYRSPETRAIFSCDPVAAAPAGTATGTANNNCRAVGRCPRLPGSGQQRACFGLPAHGLPELCEDADACE
jgi:hypothetical protein